MKIGEFVEKIQSTKDTIRFYEELNLIDPIRKGDKREYTEKDMHDFYIIKEMESLGLTIREIQTIFHLKRSAGFHSPSLLQDAQDRLCTSIKKIERAEKELSIRKMKLYCLLSKLENLHNRD
ncbi:MAG TPA: MerR family transcriptional regulator [Rummeliibacillus sp.]|nr:MerR family transcriptional regulator [Rummeliibacillus sp.]